MASSSRAFSKLICILLLIWWVRFHLEIALLHADILLSTESPFSSQALAMSFLTSSFLQSFLSYRNSPFFFLGSGSRKAMIGLWTEPPKFRYEHLPEGNNSAHKLFYMALSNLQWTVWVWRTPLHERKFLECRRSYRSHWDMKILKSMKVPSALAGPPSFSELSMMSLKSPVRNQGPVLFREISVIRCSISLRRACSGAPYVKVAKNFSFLYSISESIKLLHK